MLLLGARIWTGRPEQSSSDALLIRNGRIVAVGNAAALARESRGEVIALSGGLVVPGLHDGHTHLIDGGLWLSGVDLCGVRSVAEFEHRVVTAANALPEGAWLLGAGWDPLLWYGGGLNLPLLDGFLGDRPCLLVQADLHAGVTNSAGLARAGIAATTPDPPGGEIERDPATGEPTGMLRETALYRLRAMLPAAALDQRRVAALIALRRAATAGLTAVHDVCGCEDVDLYHSLAREGLLPVRVNALLYAPQALYNLDLLDDVRSATDLVSCRCLKLFTDGALGSRTALMDEPYLDRDTRGIRDAMAQDWEAFCRAAVAADRRGWQLAIHAIGTRANHETLNLVERLNRENGPRDRRLRIEHAQHLRPEDISRYGALGVTASVQPAHLADDGRWAARAIGEKLCAATYAFRSLADGGARLVFGSDWPVAPLDPLYAIRCAVTRQLSNDSGCWQPQEKLGVAEALQASTFSAAWVAHWESRLGRIAVGQVADLTVLSHDLLADPDTIHETRVVMTIRDGQIVHDAR